MTKAIFLTAAILSAAIVVIGYSTTGLESNPLTAITSSAAKPARSMRAFGSEQELKDYFEALLERQQRSRRDTQPKSKAANMSAGVPLASPAAEASADAARKDDESVTNTQHAGVDEGGIVKVHGEHLVILRRGRLFTVRIGDNSLKPVASVDAYAPGIDPSSDWYDEMLVSQDTVVVIGYSYGRGGTEVNLFDIDARGGLEYRSTYHLRSNDYYSSRNYASRLIGNKLIFYTPQYLWDFNDPIRQFPAVRRWHKGAKAEEFTPIVKATQVYRTDKPLESTYGVALHTVTVCDLASRGFACSASSVLGAPGRVFYVSPNSVYVWTTDWNYGDGRAKASSMLYKMPLDASAPSALGVMGSPVDQFSFLESDDERLNVLIRSEGQGEQMWLGVRGRRCRAVPCSARKFFRWKPVCSGISLSRTAEAGRLHLSEPVRWKLSSLWNRKRLGKT